MAAIVEITQRTVLRPSPGAAWGDGKKVPLTVFDCAATDGYIPTVFAWSAPAPANSALMDGLLAAVARFPHLAGRFAVDDHGRKCIHLNDAGVLVLEATAPTDLAEALPNDVSAHISKLYPDAENFMSAAADRNESMALPSLSAESRMSQRLDGDSVCLTVAVGGDDFLDHVGDHPRDTTRLRLLLSPLTKHAVFAVQVTVFPGAGICIGTTMHHAVANGSSYAHFVKTWESIHRHGLEVPPPLFDRSVVRDKGGLREAFVREHRTLADASDERLGAWDLSSRGDTVLLATFRLMEELLRGLGWRAELETSARQCSPNALAWGAVWAGIVQAHGGTGNGGQAQRFGFVTGCRARVSPPVPENYCGNCLGLCGVEADEITNLTPASAAIWRVVEGLAEEGRALRDAREWVRLARGSAAARAVSGWVARDLSIGVDRLGRADEPLFQVQLTRYTRGGLIIGMVSHHQVADGQSMSGFSVAWATAVRTNSTVHPSPFNDRATTVNPRSPPAPVFDHRNIEFKGEHSSSHSYRVLPMDRIKNLAVHFSEEFVADLKSHVGARCSTFQCLLAHVWKKVTAARDLAPEDFTQVRVAVNCRGRVEPPVPMNFFGNMVLWAFPRMQVRDLLSSSYPVVVGAIREAVAQVDDEYVQSFVDFGRGIEDGGQQLAPTAATPGTSFCPDLEVDSWLGFRFHDMDFGCGSPCAFLPPDLPIDGIMVFVPSCAAKGGVDLFIALVDEHVEAFKHICYAID